MKEPDERHVSDSSPRGVGSNGSGLRHVPIQVMVDEAHRTQYGFMATLKTCQRGFW
jgi:type I site-specific restriction-modification system R (restriction) subunit